MKRTISILTVCLLAISLLAGCGSSTVVVGKKGSIDCIALSEDADEALLVALYDNRLQELYAAVRPQAVYQRSLDVLRYCKEQYPGSLTKTGFMVGLGETEDQIRRLMDDLLDVGCDILTIGQYLQPSPDHYPLQRYVTPEEFARYKEIALEKGFRYVASTPLVRSSYRAAEALQAGGKN